MVGSMYLQDMNGIRGREHRRWLLDSPDSGVPPSPPFTSLFPTLLETRSLDYTSPPEHLGYSGNEREEIEQQPLLVPGPTTRIYPVIFREAIEVNPKPVQKVSDRWNSEVKCGSDRRYRGQVTCALVPTVTSQSVATTAAVAATTAHQRYRSELQLEPHPRRWFQSTALVFPRLATPTYRTTLDRHATSVPRWLACSVQVQTNHDVSLCITYTRGL